MLLPILIMGQGIVVGTPQGDTPAQNLDRYYDRRHEVTFSGVVTGKTKGQAPGYAQGMSILVKSGKILREVELGPSWYVGRQSASVNMGDHVRVTGMPLVLERREHVILARQIRRGNQILALRGDDGMPFWDARRTRVAVRNNNTSGAAERMDNSYNGTISSMNTFDVNGEPYAGYVLNTPQGPMNVALAPTWYWNNQNTRLNVGDQVTLFTNGPSTTIRNGLGTVTLANSFDYSGGTIFLRQPGGLNPVYQGFQPLGGSPIFRP